ncbi:MAG: M20/M25/M40 family metallo-hydrolase [Roseicyclus sp.]|uniref:M20/M25/M40 family metallo-hydrolase n=1 Tax=Roseicyclus sp. TaxID=1914329 RepID=UPI003BB0477C
MNPLELPFDTDEMIAGLRPWIECESPTYDAVAVNRMMDIAAYDMATLGAQIDWIPGRMGFGGSVRARFPHPDMGRVPGILIAGHMDTVHPVGTLEVLPFRREGNICYGPGLMDMKGGNYISLDAIRQMIRAGLQTPLPVTVLFTPDEEVGTPSTRDLIEQEAARNKYVLVPEPGHEDGGVTIGRYAIARFNLRTTGQPSHAGARLGDGKSAIAAMARKIVEIEGMTGPDCTFSVGVIHAGQWVNCVSSFCDAQALTMAKKQEDLDDGVARMMALQGEVNGVKFEVERGVTRPVWHPDQPGTQAIFNIAKDIAQELGFDMKGRSQGGGSDANFTGAMGIASLDSLGVLGNGLHTLNEHIFVDSLTQRAKLIAGLLMRLS